MFGIFRKKSPITVTIKLYSGLHRDLNIKNYDLGKGLIINTVNGASLRSVLKEIGMENRSSISYFLNGGRISLGTSLKDGDEVSCLKPSGGG